VANEAVSLGLVALIDKEQVASELELRVGEVVSDALAAGDDGWTILGGAKLRRTRRTPRISRFALRAGFVCPNRT
jgi:hypothetical protein